MYFYKREEVTKSPAAVNHKNRSTDKEIKNSDHRLGVLVFNFTAAY
jgi:hypothetical protein